PLSVLGVLTPCPPLREVLTPCPPLRSGDGGLMSFPLSRRERGSGGEDRTVRRTGVEDHGYPPAIAPITRNGSAPDATASGSGASGGSWVRSRSHAKNRRNGRRCAVTWSRMVPRNMG